MGQYYYLPQQVTQLNTKKTNSYKDKNKTQDIERDG